jgi:tRNA(Arg) A34 adenosine deaminase TadA
MRLHQRLRPLVAILLLVGVVTAALWMPIPTTGNAQLDQVVGEVRQRLPGWRIVQADASWEGAYTVVASCGSRELGFQLVPEHGLPVGDSWVQPNDLYARTRLEHVSDHDRMQLQRDPTAHAVLLTIQAAARKLETRRLSDVTIFTTHEPCTMCVGALVEAQVRALVFAVPDERRGAAGSVLQLARDSVLPHQMAVISGVREAEARRLGDEQPATA